MAARKSSASSLCRKMLLALTDFKAYGVPAVKMIYTESKAHLRSDYSPALVCPPAPLKSFAPPKTNTTSLSPSRHYKEQRDRNIHQRVFASGHLVDHIAN